MIFQDKQSGYGITPPPRGAVVGDYAYVADGGNGLVIIEINPPDTGVEGGDDDGNGGFLSGFEPIALLLILATSGHFFRKKRR